MNEPSVWFVTHVLLLTCVMLNDSVTTQRFIPGIPSAILDEMMISFWNVGSAPGNLEFLVTSYSREVLVVGIVSVITIVGVVPVITIGGILMIVVILLVVGIITVITVVGLVVLRPLK